MENGKWMVREIILGLVPDARCPRQASSSSMERAAVDVADSIVAIWAIDLGREDAGLFGQRIESAANLGELPTIRDLGTRRGDLGHRPPCPL